MSEQQTIGALMEIEERFDKIVEKFDRLIEINRKRHDLSRTVGSMTNIPEIENTENINSFNEDLRKIEVNLYREILEELSKSAAIDLDLVLPRIKLFSFDLKKYSWTTMEQRDENTLIFKENTDGKTELEEKPLE